MSAASSPSNMMSAHLLPIQQAVQMTMQHHYNFKFAEVARAFMLKYNIENRFCFTTIASTRQLDEDRFEIVRRMENVMSSKPIYERIIFDRSSQTVRGFTFESESENIYTECYEYRQDKNDVSRTHYQMLLYKNPGLKKMLRFKLHNWGVQTLEGIIKKEQEYKAKAKELLKEGGEKLDKGIEKVKESVLEAKDKATRLLSNNNNKEGPSDLNKEEAKRS